MNSNNSSSYLVEAKHWSLGESSFWDPNGRQTLIWWRGQHNMSSSQNPDATRWGRRWLASLNATWTLASPTLSFSLKKTKLAVSLAGWLGGRPSKTGGQGVASLNSPPQCTREGCVWYVAASRVCHVTEALHSDFSPFSFRWKLLNTSLPAPSFLHFEKDYKWMVFLPVMEQNCCCVRSHSFAIPFIRVLSFVKRSVKESKWQHWNNNGGEFLERK